jgi:hypothetical protein
MDNRDDSGDDRQDSDGDRQDSDGDRRVWLVERTYTDKGLVSLVYATTDGAHAVQRQRSTNALQRAGVTAATTVDSESLDPVDDDGTREQYADEAERMADRHDPDDAV